MADFWVLVMDRYLRFRDLVDLGIVSNWTTLGRWIRDGKFPAGVWLGPRSRAWPEQEIANWMANRPTSRPDGEGGQ